MKTYDVVGWHSMLRAGGTCLMTLFKDLQGRHPAKLGYGYYKDNTYWLGACFALSSNLSLVPGVKRMDVYLADIWHICSKGDTRGFLSFLAEQGAEKYLLRPVKYAKNPPKLIVNMFEHLNRPPRFFRVSFDVTKTPAHIMVLLLSLYRLPQEFPQVLYTWEKLNELHTETPSIINLFAAHALRFPEEAQSVRNSAHLVVPLTVTHIERTLHEILDDLEKLKLPPAVVNSSYSFPHRLSDNWPIDRTKALWSPTMYSEEVYKSLVERKEV